MKAVYHVGDVYPPELLSRYRVELFDVEEFEWKYGLLKTTHRK